MSYKDWFHEFNDEGLEVPDALNYPHYYYPKPIAISAARNLQQKLESGILNHDFFNAVDPQDGGKMFGVLVGKDIQGRIGYLAGFSGNIMNKTSLPGFVPPIFDLKSTSNFFLKEEEEIVAITNEIDQILCNSEYQDLNLAYQSCVKNHEIELSDLKLILKERKKHRKAKREKTSDLVKLEELNHESAQDRILLKTLKQKQKKEIIDFQNRLNDFSSQLEFLAKERAFKSAQLQTRLFESYVLLNSRGEKKDLITIFKAHSDKFPPAASGECAAPKLFQFAFLNQIEPIALAEFWWGRDTINVIRKHKQFYPACKSKCEPILSHMLNGLKVEENPLLNQGNLNDIDIVYNDSDITIINKPSGVLSVPGKTNLKSVKDWFIQKFPSVTGPLMVHRLDMHTSGIMVLAKNKEVYVMLQKAFLHGKVKKSYEAVLIGEPKHKEGEINLPLIADVEDRPKQKVDFDNGKPARTIYHVLGFFHGKSLVEFQPVTGRTHQLRVHAAHPLGLDCPIYGDELYSIPEERLCLHAKKITLPHPVSKKDLVFECPSNFMKTIFKK